MQVPSSFQTDKLELQAPKKVAGTITKEALVQPGVDRTEKSEYRRQDLYYVTQEIRALLSILLENMQIQLLPEQNDRKENIITEYFRSIAQILQEEFSVETFNEEYINRELKALLLQELAPHQAVVSLDRFLLRDNDSPIYRIGISRQSDGTKGPRQGYASIEEQIARLKKALPSDCLLLMDDGLFSGGTMRYAVSELQKAGLKVEKIVVFAKNPNLSDIDNIPIKAVHELLHMKDWIDGRDLGLKGGTLQKKPLVFHDGNEGLKVPVSKPYMAPFSNGNSLSLDRSSNFLKISQLLLEKEREFLNAIQSLIGRTISIADLQKSRLPVPYHPDIPLALDTALIDINNAAIEIIKLTRASLDNITGVISDMDGTLYPFDSEQKTYEGSTFQSEILRNSLSFIQEKESCDTEEAERIFSEAQTHGSESVYLAKKYGMTRGEVLDGIWGKMDVTKIVKNATYTKEVINHLQQKGKQLILVTGAPKVWAEKVLRHLGVEQSFEKVITAETYIHKSEVFEQLAQEVDAKQFLVIGDIVESDIAPAQKFGFEALHINHDNRSLNLLLHIE